MGRTLAQQSIEESIIEESDERARRGGSRTLAQHALDQSADELRRKQGAKAMADEHGPDIPEHIARSGNDALANVEGAIRDIVASRQQQRAPATNGGAVGQTASAERRYLPTLADLIDRLTITQMKAIFIQDHTADYLAERELIEHDIDGLLSDPKRAPLTALDVRAIIIVMLTNRCIWESESKARAGGDDQDHLLKFTHSVNGVRNAAKNILSRSQGERLDWKVDCFAESLIAEFGNWQVFGDGK